MLALPVLDAFELQPVFMALRHARWSRDGVVGLLQNDYTVGLSSCGVLVVGELEALLLDLLKMLRNPPTLAIRGVDSANTCACLARTKGREQLLLMYGVPQGRLWQSNIFLAP